MDTREDEGEAIHGAAAGSTAMHTCNCYCHLPYGAPTFFTLQGDTKHCHECKCVFEPDIPPCEHFRQARKPDGSFRCCVCGKDLKDTEVNIHFVTMSDGISPDSLASFLSACSDGLHADLSFETNTKL